MYRRPDSFRDSSVCAAARSVGKLQMQKVREKIRRQSAVVSDESFVPSRWNFYDAIRNRVTRFRGETQLFLFPLLFSACTVALRASYR